MKARTSPRVVVRPVRRVLATSAAAVLGVGGGIASAQAGDQTAQDPSVQTTTTTSEATTGSTGGSGQVRALRLRAEQVAPRKIRYAGTTRARFTYEIGGSEPRDLIIEVVRRGKRKVLQRWRHKNVPPGQAHTQTWGGRTKKKKAAKSGRYLFRVRERGGALAERAANDGQRSFHYYDHIFPVRGKHGYGDGIGAGRGHQGQDVFARCGTPLVAARGGKVRHKGFHGRAGHYLVIKGKKSRWDYVYMHLRRKSKLRKGARVKTGQRIGAVGQTGNARGCHLHFELWSKPGWYRGGRFHRSVTRKLRKWDSWG